MTHAFIFATVLLVALAAPGCSAGQREHLMLRNVSPAMEPTLREGEVVAFERFADSLAMARTVARDDLVLYVYPRDSTKQFVKRLVGLPGDTLAMQRGILIRNGQRVAEPYARFADSSATATRHNWGPLVVPASSYFVLGDNRDRSLDSRYWAYIPSRFIAGRAVDPESGTPRR